MLAASFWLLLHGQALDLKALDAAARARDVASVQRMAAVDVHPKLRFLKSNGAYDTGRFGWSAIALRDVASDRQYVVFSTPLTSEDIGEQVFEVRGGRLARYVDELEKQEVRIEHHVLSVSFDIARKRAMVTDSVRFSRSSAAARSFLARISPVYRVYKVSDAAGRAVRFAQSGGVLSLPTPDGQGSFTYKLEYSGVVDRPGYAGSISAVEANLTNDYWYPMIERRPATHETSIHVPAGWVGVTQGDLMQSGPGVFRYKMDLPSIYFSLTAAPFRQTTHTEGGKSYHVWAASMSEAGMRIQAEINPLIIETFARFAAYPFKSWGALISKLYGGGALEAYSYATYGEGWLPDEDPHEPAHTWFGGIINNTYLRSLWNESFANFMEGYYRREAPLGNRDERRLAFVSDASPDPAYRVETVASGGAYTGPAAVSLGYGKGSKVLAMLENEIGTDKLVESFRRWLATHPKGEPGEWEDYEKVVDAVVGTSYKPFFDQWLRRKGWMELDVADVRWADGKVVGRFVQPEPAYKATVEVMLELQDGSREFWRVSTVPARFDIPSATRPKLVSFDPWRRLLRTYGQDEAPVSIEGKSGPGRLWVEAGRESWMKPLQRGRTPVKEAPSDPIGWIVIGSPETSPLVAQLCAKVGFSVQDGKLSYDGTTVDLASGGAIAVVPLSQGKECLLGLGNVALAPHTGRARLVVMDKYGRFLRGVTEPKTAGKLTVRL